MKTLSKYCKSLKQAERFQNKLYNTYPYVRLLSYPIFTEDGIYTFEISL